MEFWHEHFNYIMDLRGILQIGVDLYNKLLGNTYIKSLPQLRYSDSIFTLTCTIFLVVNKVNWHSTPGQYILYNPILKSCLVWTSDKSGENDVNYGTYNFQLYLV